MKIWQFRTLLIVLWALLIADIANPGYLEFLLPVVGEVNLRSLHSTQ
ncbi:MAG: hypothetical protein AAF635_12610 [Cyanobacteria bacterium P01_C01_bin.69]